MPARSHTNQKIPDLPRAQHFVSFQNGDPGLKRIIVKVNGVVFKQRTARAGRARDLDIASAMTSGVNNVAVEIEGNKHATATVIFHDGSASLLG